LVGEELKGFCIIKIQFFSASGGLRQGVRGTSSCSEDADRRHRRDGMSTVMCDAEFGHSVAKLFNVVIGA